MGQRTQLVLKTKDRFGKVQNKVYHEQWGFAKTMPMIILEFLTSLNYGSTGQRENIDCFRQASIVSLKELDAMSKADRQATEERLKQYSVHNLKLNSWDVSEEYTKNFIYNKGEYNENLRSPEIDGIKGTPILEWDFDINNPDNVRQFTGDNNDGLALVSVEEKVVQKSYGVSFEYEIKVGFLVSDYGTRRGVHKYHDIYSYTKQWKDYCPKNIIKAIETLYEYFGVEQLGKKEKPVKAEV